ncbi:conserved hypothetical protein [Frankia canadensis]|uniref:Uncharacterized protein n=1 Tax=Frankia canadensis TaxID=1836972 RepID=A0A2I2KZ05_9ACTN|nr:conserved hypothetical protein [Frankia canadensis]SOU58170.1 conserved hypothetical protein [Frankia canadensis]
MAGRARGRASARVDEDDLAVEITAAVPSELGPLGLWRRVLQLEPAGGPRGAGGRRGAPHAGTGHRGAGRVGSVTNGHGRRT